jgi:membrane-associated phospholipid phosphatase
MPEGLLELSLQLTFWLQGLGSWLAPVMQFFTFLGNEEFYLFVLPVFVWAIDYRLGFRVGVMLLLTTGINDLAKMSFRQPRPYWVNPKAAGFAEPAGGFGLPSGHAQTSLSIFGLLAYEVKKRWLTIVAVVSVFMIGMSRVYRGEHFLTDVLAGWLIGGIVLFAYVKLAGPVERWFSGLGFGTRVGAVFAYSLAFILLMAVVISVPADYQVPSDWLANAAQAYPDSPIEPLTLSSPITSAAALFGVALGYFWTEQRGGFNARKGSWRQRLLRFLVGLVGVAVFWMGLDLIFPGNEDLISWTLRYVRYALTGLWISGLAPLVFIKLGLGEKGS